MRRLISLLFLLGATVQLTAQIRDSLVRYDTLANGLTYYVRANDLPAGRAELRLLVRAGSLQEADDQRGLAHFVEHMAFNGTKQFPKNELIDYLESTGMRFGPDLNAYTSFEETVYMLEVRTDPAGKLDTGLAILKEWANGLTFDPVEIEKERGVVLSEWRTRLNADQRQRQQIIPFLYGGSRYANRLPIGDPDLLANTSAEAIIRYYREWYRPDLMCVVAVGDFDPDKVEQAIRSLFSPLDKPTEPPTEIEVEVPDTDIFRYLIAADEEASFVQVEWYRPLPKQSLTDSVAFRQNLMHALYNRLMGARLYEVQQSMSEPPFTFASSVITRGLGDQPQYLLSAFVAPEQLTPGFRTVLETTMQVRQHGFVDSELDRKKEELLLRYEQAAREEKAQRSAALAAQLANHALNGAPYMTSSQTLARVEKALPTITLSDINALLSAWWSEPGSSLVVKVPERLAGQMPTTDEWQSLIHETETQTYDTYLDSASDKPLFQRELPDLTATLTFRDTSLGVYEYRLPNDVRLVVRPTDFKQDEVLMSAFSQGGHSVYSDAEYPNASTAAVLVDQSGVGEFNITQLTKKLTGSTVSVAPYIGEWHEGFNGSASPRDLEEMLQLVHLYATAPRKDTTVLSSYRTRQRSILENILDNPYYFFGEASFRIRYGNHPRRGIPTVEQLQALDLNRMLEIYRERFADFSDFTFVFVGNLDMETFPDLAAKYLGALPANHRDERWQDTGTRLVPGVIDSTIVGGQAPKAIVEINFHGDITYTSDQRYLYSSLMSLVRIRLRERLREEMGGVYGVRVSGTLLPIPEPNFRTAIRFDADPHEADTLIHLLYQEIRQLQSEPVTPGYLQKITETQRQSREEARATNSYWLGQLATRYRNHIPLRGIQPAVFEHFVQSLTAKDLQVAAQRYFNWNSYIQLVLQPDLPGLR
jgi:zinc protease